MTNYSKYINSTSIHYISNSGSDENGNTHGGKAGDQTGKEWQLKAWYNRPWTCVLRHPDPVVRQMIAEFGIDAALNNKIGYDQYQRYTYWEQLKVSNYRPANIKSGCEADCSEGVTANVKAIGYILGIPKLYNITIYTSSRDMREKFKAADFKVLTDRKYLTGTGYLLPGDILLYENHHAATNITVGENVRNSYSSLSTATTGTENKTTSSQVQSQSQSSTSTIISYPVVLKNGMSGSAVKDMQSKLIRLDYDLGRWGADGDYGDQTQFAVEAFQEEHGLTVTGVFDEKTKTALEDAIKKLDTPVDNPTKVYFVGDCNIRDKANTNGKILGVAKNGSYLPYKGQTASNGWLSVEYKNQIAWTSGVYGRLVK